MQIMLIVGAVIGTLLYLTKLGLFVLVTKPFPGLRRWIHRHALAQAVLDTIFGFLGMHVVSLSGGSLTAMISMVVFGAWSMLYIFMHIVLNWGKEVYHNVKYSL